MSSPQTFTKAQLEEMVASVGFWWHSIHLGQGVVTKGFKTPEILAHEVASIRFPDLKGKTVLDVGAWDGFFSFEAERRGAKRVVALDHYVWSLNLSPSMQDREDKIKRGLTCIPPEQTPNWHPVKLPGKRGYDLAHQVLNSNVETVVGDFMTMDLEPLGSFDVVFFFGVLYHMENPLASLRRLASLTKDVALIETHAIAIPGYEHLELCEFYSSDQLNHDPTNWWGPNLKALEGMCRAAGFARFEVVYSSNPLSQVPSGSRTPPYSRAMAHAWK